MAVVVIVTILVPMVVIAALAIMSMVPTIITSVLVTVVIIPTVTMVLPITRDVLVVIPVVLYKVDPLAAGVVPVAMLAPVLAMPGRYAHIDRLFYHDNPLDDPRLTIDHTWLRVWVIADVDSPIEARLADANRHSDVGSECGSGECGCGNCRGYQKSFHADRKSVV